MNVDTVQQLIRIVLYSVGAFVLGNGVADGELFQAALGSIGPIIAFIWWLVWERKRVK